MRTLPWRLCHSWALFLHALLSSWNLAKINFTGTRALLLEVVLFMGSFGHTFSTSWNLSNIHFTGMRAVLLEFVLFMGARSSGTLS